MDYNAYHLKRNHHMRDMCRQLNTMLCRQELVDVTLSCTDGLLKAHRLILSACSPYFENIFRDNSCKHPIVILKGISTKEMGYLLSFMYEGYVDVMVEDFQSFISTANELKIRGLSFVILHKSPRGNVQLGKNDTQEPDTEGIKIEEDSELNILDGMQDDNGSMESNLDEKERNEEMDQRETASALGVSQTDDERTSTKTAETTKFTTEASTTYNTRFKGRKRVSVGGNEEECNQGCCETTIKKRNFGTHSRAAKSPITYMVCSEKSNARKTGKQDVGFLSMNTLSETTIKKEKEDVEMQGDTRCSNNTVCAFCFLDCHTSADLTKHLRVHTGEKPYECDICNLAFSSAPHLARHRSVHTAERPFTCLSCGRNYNGKDSLKRHKRRHHEMDGHESYGTGPAGRFQLDAGENLHREL